MTKSAASSSAQRNAASVKLGRSRLTGAFVAKPANTASSASAKRVRKVVQRVVADRAH